MSATAVTALISSKPLSDATDAHTTHRPVRVGVRDVVQNGYAARDRAAAAASGAATTSTRQRAFFKTSWTVCSKTGVCPRAAEREPGAPQEPLRSSLSTDTKLPSQLSQALLEPSRSRESALGDDDSSITC